MLGNKKIWYGLGLDNNNLKADAKQSKSILQGISDKAVQEGKKIDTSYKKLAKGVAVVLSTGAMSAFVSKIATVRGEFQQLEVALTTMLGSKIKADALMARTVEFAAKTPFDLKGVATATKQLLAYGSVAESVTDEIGMLGNIASGLGIPLNDLVYLYGTTRTQGRLFTQDLRQFMGRGIPLAEELAKQFNVSKSEVQGLVTAGKVGFPQVEIALRNMTSQGGKFYNLMEEQSKTITGKISNLGDAMDTMWNDMGKSQEGVIGDGLDLTISLVENYKEVGQIIAELIALYGTYKAVLMTMTAIQSINQSVMIRQAWATNTLTFSQRLGAVATVTYQRAMASLNATMMLNPYALLAIGIAGLLGAIYKYNTASTLAERATENFNEKMQERKELAEEERNSLEKNIETLKDDTKTRSEQQKALETLQSKYPKYFDNLDVEKAKYVDIKNILKEVNEQLEEKNLLQDKAKLDSLKEELAKIKEDPSSLKAINSAMRRASFSTGNIGLGFANMFGLGDIEADEAIEALEKQIDLYSKQVKEAERLQFEALSNQEKIEVKNKENTEFERLLESSRLKESDKAEIKKNIQDNNRLIAQWQKEESDTPLRSRSDVMKEITELEKNINALEVKSITGISDKEKSDLKEYKEELKTLNSELELLSGKKTTKTSKSTYDALQVELENKRKIEDATYESEMLKIKIQEDGVEKSLALLKLEGDRKLQLLKRQKEDAISEMKADSEEDAKNNPDYKAEDWTARISEYEKIWDATIEKQGQENLKNTNKFLQSELDAYLTNEEKKIELSKQAKQKIADLEFLGKQEGDADKYAGKINVVKKELEEALFELEKLSNKSVIGKLFGDTTKLTVSEMKELIIEAEELYKNTPKTDENVEKLKAIRSQINELKQAVIETESVFDRMGENINKIFSGKLNKQELAKAIGELSSDFAVVNDAVGFFSDSMNSLGESTGSTALQEISAGLNDVMEVAGKTMEGIEKGAAVGGTVGAVIGGAIGLASSMASVIAKRKDAKQEKEIQRLQKQVETLEKSYDSLGKAIDDAYASDASNLIQQQDANLRNQKRLIEAQIRAEEKKKKTDKDKIEQWKDAIDQINEQLAESENRQIEAINGKSVQEAINDFATAYVNAWSAGEDKATAMKDVVRNMVKSAVTELVKGRMSGEVEAFSSYLAKAMEDGILTVTEKNILDQIQRSINSKVAGLSDTLDEYLLDEETDFNREAVEKGFASMSQDTADELNGRFTVIQGHTFAIAEAMVTMKDLGERQLQHLSGINYNTSRLLGIENDIAIMKNGIEDINTLGIKLR